MSFGLQVYIDQAFINKWWFILVLAAILFYACITIIKTTSKFNKQLLNNFSESNYPDYEFKIYFLYLGSFFLLAEIVYMIFTTREIIDVIIHTIMGLLCLVVYFLSEKIKIVQYNLRNIQLAFFLFFTLFTFSRLMFGHFNIILFTEISMLFYYSYIAFGKIKNYNYFVVSSLLLLCLIFYIKQLKSIEVVSLIILCIVILLINYARRIGTLNINEKYIFSKNIIDNSNTLTIATDKMGNVSYCGNSIQKILGYKPEEVMGENFWQLTEDRDYQKVDYNLIFKPNSIYIRKLKCKNGEYKFIQWIDYKYSENLFVANGQDITQKVTLEKKYSDLVQSARDVIYEMDSIGFVQYVNAFTQHLLGYKEEEIVGHHFSKFIPKEHKKRVLEFYNNSNDNFNEFDLLEFPLIKSDGTRIWVSQSVTIKRDVDNKIIGYSAIIRDVTYSKLQEIEEQKRIERITYLNNIPNRLSTLNFLKFKTLKSLIEHITIEAANGLDIERVSFWFKNNNKIELFNMFVKSTNEHLVGKVLHRDDFQNYFKAIENESIIIASNITENSPLNDFSKSYFKEYDIKSALDIPIYISGKLIGVLCFEQSYQIKNWTNEDINFAKTVAEIIALAIETIRRKEAENEIRYKSEILSAINFATSDLLTKTSLEEVFNDSLCQVARVIKANRFYFFENNAEKKEFSQKFEWVSSSEYSEKNNPKLQNIPYKNFKSLIEVLLKNEPFNTLIKEIKEKALRESLESQNIKSILIIPLIYQDNFYGCIGFDDCLEERKWTNSEIQTLKTLASNLASTIIRIENESQIIENQEKTKFKNEVLALISNYTSKLIQKTHIEDFYDESLANLTKLINSDRICLILIMKIINL